MAEFGTTSTPTRGTSEIELSQFNALMRQSPVYLNFMRRNGLPTGGRVTLSRAQQTAFERKLVSAGIQIPRGMHVDQGANLNQKNRLGKTSIIVGAVALTAFGIPGVFPGLLTAGGGGAAAAGTTAATGGASTAGPAGLGWTLPAASAPSVLRRGAQRLGKLSTGDWIDVAGSWGLNLWNNWQNARATDERFRAEFGYDRQRLAEEQRQFDLNFDLARDREARAGAEFASTYGLERDRYGLARQQYEQTESNRRPYVRVGVGALGNLARGTRTEMAPVDQVPTPPQYAGLVTPGTSMPLSAVGRSAQPRPSLTSTVMMRAPNGQTKAIPADQVAYYTARGAEQVVA